RATIRNISVGGLLVHSEDQLLPGALLEFGFQTPGGAELRLRADVRHVQHRPFFATDVWEAGCEFRETDMDSREQLVRFVLNHQETPRPSTATLASRAALPSRVTLRAGRSTLWRHREGAHTRARRSARRRHTAGPARARPPGAVGRLAFAARQLHHWRWPAPC